MVRIYMLWLDYATKSYLLFPNMTCSQCIYGDIGCNSFIPYCAYKIACSWYIYIYK